MKGIILFIGLFGLTINTATSHESNNEYPSGQLKTINIYIDGSVDMDYIRTHLTIVNFVQEPRYADVHIQLTSIANASGGEEFRMVIKGQNSFSARYDTIYYSLNASTTAETARITFLNYLKLGLVPYFLKIGSGDGLTLLMDEGKALSFPSLSNERWMFLISGSGSFFREKSSRNYSLTANFYASKVTPELKIESSNQFGYSEERLKYFIEDSLVYSFYFNMKYMSCRNLIVKSLGDHWGIGGFASVRNSDRTNLRFQAIFGPAIEYNFFSYEEASSRQLRLLYSPTYVHNNYADTSIFNKMKDDLFMHELKLMFEYYQTWGYFSANANVSNYFNDFSKYSAGLNAFISVVLPRGFSFNVDWGFLLTQNQVSLKKQDADIGLWLKEMQEMKNDYSVNFSIGLEYRFGATTNNTVNPRFDLL